MAEYRDYLGDKLRLVERARENDYFRKLDQELIAKMRQEAAETAEQAQEASPRPTNLFTPILVPVDFSPYSVQALERAADVAERFDSSLILLHVIAAQAGVQAVAQHLGVRAVAPEVPEGAAEHPEVSDEEVETVIGQQREQAYTALQAFIPPRVAQRPCELRVVFGRPFERIVETAVKEQVDLIVLGTHGRTGLARVALGSVAERVVRLAPCPVLTVKAPTPESESWLKDFYSSFLGDAD
jgi:nucleotide-binding universal stress UspA family protein